jgi:hypothetical protein
VLKASLLITGGLEHRVPGTDQMCQWRQLLAIYFAAIGS